MTIRNNALYRCGRVNGPVISQSGNIDGVFIENNVLIECGSSTVVVSPFYFVQNANATVAKVKTLRVNGNVVQAAGSYITDIARSVYRPNEVLGVTYSDVNRDGNTPSAIPGGAENVQNYP